MTGELAPTERALLDALNDLFQWDWVAYYKGDFCVYRLCVSLPGLEPFEFERHIQPRFINGQPYRTALKFVDEVAEPLGRYIALRPDIAQE